MSKTILWFGLAMALLLGGLKWFEYRFFAHDLTLEMYMGIVGLFCMCLGGWIVWKWNRKGEINTDLVHASDGLTNMEKPKSNGFDFGLSPREVEVLHLIAQGLSYQEIASQLGVSLSTIKTHASNIFSKMDVQRRTQAVMVAQKNGLLPPAKG